MRSPTLSVRALSYAIAILACAGGTLASHRATPLPLRPGARVEAKKVVAATPAPKVTIGTARKQTRPAAHPVVGEPDPAHEVVQPALCPLAGKGMWIWQMGKIAGGDPERIVRNAVNLGISHVYVRVGSGAKGLNTLAQASSLLGPAHRAGLKVIAWYFPYFNDITEDVAWSVQAIRHVSRGDRFDAFAADVEPAYGSAFSAATGSAYSRALRDAVPEAYLIVVPPRPSPYALKTYPYDAVIPHYDAVAPMVYWGRYDPEQTVVDAIRFFASTYGKPVAPIGQAYDMGPEGGPKGNPPPWQSWAFMRASKEKGAVGVSFWVWEQATTPEFHSIREFPW